MCSSDPPPPPDYTGAAVQQGEAARGINVNQTWANRPTQNTPWGNTTWENVAATDPGTGLPVTQWTQNQTLNPQLQQALNTQLGLQGQRSDLAGSFMGRVAQDYKNPFDLSGVQGFGATPRAGGLDTGAPDQTTFAGTKPGFSQERQRIEQGLFDRMAPQHKAQEEQIRTMLTNQGLTPGSEAYDRELERMQQQQAGERFNAMQIGGAEQQRLHDMLQSQQQQAFGQDVAGQQAQNQALGQMFGQNMQASNYENQMRQQQIAEQAMMRGMSLNEMNALLTGQQVQSPNMPTFMGAQSYAPPDLLGALGMQGQYQLGAAKMENDQNAAMWKGVGALAGAAATMF